MSNSCSEGLECLGRFAGELLRGINAAGSRLYVAPRWTCPVCFSRFMVLCPQSADSLLLGPRSLKVCFVTVYQAFTTLGSPQFCSLCFSFSLLTQGLILPFCTLFKLHSPPSPPQFLTWGSYILEKPAPLSPRVVSGISPSCSPAQHVHTQPAPLLGSLWLHRRVKLGETEGMNIL